MFKDYLSCTHNSLIFLNYLLNRNRGDYFVKKKSTICNAFVFIQHIYRLCKSKLKKKKTGNFSSNYIQIFSVSIYQPFLSRILELLLHYLSETHMTNNNLLLLYYTNRSSRKFQFNKKQKYLLLNNFFILFQN